MTAEMKFVVTGGERAAKAMREFADNAQNLRDIGPKIHSALIKDHVRAFKTNGRAIGEDWPGYTGQELVYGFIKVKLTQGTWNASKFSEPIAGPLRWTRGQERLFPSVVSSSHPEHVWRIKDGKFEFGTSVPYAANHQEGKGRGPWWAGFPKIKQRRFLKLTRSTAAKITRLIRSHMGLGVD
jgi:hypothetical protein